MRRRLMLVAAFSSVLVLLVLAVALGPLVRPRASEKLEIELRSQIMEVARFVADAPTPAEAAAFLATVDVSPHNRLGLVSSTDRTPIGRDAARLDRWVGPDSRFLDRISPTPRDFPGALSPRFFGEGAGDLAASQGVRDGTTFWIIEGTVPVEVIDDQELQQWLTVIGLGAVALAVALAGAALVANRLTRPVHLAIAAAESLGSGDLTATAPVRGPREVVELGVSLNKLASRIDRLLASERERAATLSHRLRTPLTALRMETERFAEHEDTRADERRRLRAALETLERGLDDVIRESRNTREQGLHEQADAREVLRRHAAYWADIARAQGRVVSTEIDDGEPVRVALTAQDLGIALDAVLSNAFRHTRVDAPVEVRLTGSKRAVTVVIWNSGDARQQDTGESTGSTGMGLAIARGVVEAAGGSLTAAADDGQGFSVRLTLPVV